MIKRLLLRTVGRFVPTDIFAPRYPVSVKGLCFIDDKVILLKNERGEWDLPGGKLEKGETLEAALAREIKEELGIKLCKALLIDALKIQIHDRIDVLVVIYHCQIQAAFSDLKISHESFEVALFGKEQLHQIGLPERYTANIVNCL